MAGVFVICGVVSGSYSSKVELGTVNTEIDVRFILGAKGD